MLNGQNTKQTPNLKLQTSNKRPQTTDHRLPRKYLPRPIQQRRADHGIILVVGFVGVVGVGLAEGEGSAAFINAGAKFPARIAGRHATAGEYGEEEQVADAFHE